MLLKLRWLPFRQWIIQWVSGHVHYYRYVPMLVRGETFCEQWSFSYFSGTGDVLKIQSLLHICSEHHAGSEAEEKSESTAGGGGGATAAGGSGTTSPASGASAAAEDQSSDGASGKKKKTKPKVEPGSLTEPGSHQGLATLGIALLAMGENIGMDMCLRMYNHLVSVMIINECYVLHLVCGQLQYSEPVIRRTVPLALALLSMSHPQLSVIDTLSKLSHDSDSDVVHNAILAMGLVGSGDHG